MGNRHSEPESSQEGQGGLFDDEPKPNSPEDLGLGVPFTESDRVKPPAPEEPKNFSPYAIKLGDCRKLVEWLNAEGIPVNEAFTPGRCLVEFSGLGLDDLRWLCLACKQAGKAPDPARARRAIFARDVRILRPGGDTKTTQKGSP